MNLASSNLSKIGNGRRFGNDDSGSDGAGIAEVQSSTTNVSVKDGEVAVQSQKRRPKGFWRHGTMGKERENGLRRHTRLS